jgi:hypothetical protein
MDKEVIDRDKDAVVSRIREGVQSILWEGVVI